MHALNTHCAHTTLHMHTHTHTHIHTVHTQHNTRARRCILTYEVGVAHHPDGPFKQVNRKHLLFPLFVHWETGLWQGGAPCCVYQLAGAGKAHMCCHVRLHMQQNFMARCLEPHVLLPECQWCFNSPVLLLRPQTTSLVNLCTSQW